MSEINSLLDDSGADWDVINAYAINDHGWIIGSAYDSDFNERAVLLTTLNPLPGDYNYDSVVNAADYTVWRDSFGSTWPGHPADGNLNNQVDLDDMSIWKASFGETVDGGAGSISQQVPEASTVALAVTTLCVCRYRRRQRQ